MAFGKRYYLKIDPVLPSAAVWVQIFKRPLLSGLSAEPKR
jgi:hypothetical protein